MCIIEIHKEIFASKGHRVENLQAFKKTNVFIPYYEPGAHIGLNVSTVRNFASAHLQDR